MITIDVNPTPAQSEIHHADARFRVVDAGRRFGKTRLGVNECLEVAAAGKRAWWIAPSYKMSEVGWRPLRRIATKIPGADVHKGERSVKLPGGGEVWVRSADDPQSLRGEGLHFVVFDECAYMKPETWAEAIRPALSDTNGRALFISTPRGRNWFWQIYQRGQNKEDGWWSKRYTTYNNPYIPESEIEAAKKELPEIIFRQEYMAEFIDDGGGVFRKIQQAAMMENNEPRKALEGPQSGRQYVAGVDVAASIDYTVVSVFDVEAHEQVYIDRFNRVDYNVLEDRLEAVYKRWNMNSMVVEINSIGQGVVDHLYNRNMTIIPFTTTNATKQEAIQALQSAFEHGNIRIINDMVQIGELLSFESKRNASGSFSYSAPDGMHDDTVMGMALAWSGINEPQWFMS